MTQQAKAAEEHADTTNQEAIQLRHDLLAAQQKVKKLEDEKAASKTFIKALRRESNARTSKLETYEWDLAELKNDVP